MTCRGAAGDGAGCGEDKERPLQSASLGVVDQFPRPKRPVLGGRRILGLVLSAGARPHLTLLVHRPRAVPGPCRVGFTPSTHPMGRARGYSGCGVVWWGMVWCGVVSCVVCGVVCCDVMQCHRKGWQGQCQDHCAGSLFLSTQALTTHLGVPPDTCNCAVILPAKMCGTVL